MTPAVRQATRAEISGKHRVRMAVRENGAHSTHTPGRMSSWRSSGPLSGSRALQVRIHAGTDGDSAGLPRRAIQKYAAGYRSSPSCLLRTACSRSSSPARPLLRSDSSRERRFASGLRIAYKSVADDSRAVTTNPGLTSDAALRRTMVLVTQQGVAEAAPRPTVSGVYHDQWRKTHTGWRLAHRAAHVDRDPGFSK